MTTTTCDISIATRFTPASTGPFLKSTTTSSDTTPVMTSSAGPKSSRFPSTPTSSILTACGCSCSVRNSRPRQDRGTSLLRYRYEDPNHGDDTWAWEPGTRRLRRLNEAMNSTATGARTYSPDHYSGFNPKTEQYDYKFLGEKEMLGTVDAEHSPEMRCATDGGGSACPERWQMRHMYIVSAEPRRSVNNAEALDSKSGHLHGFRNVVRAVHRYLRSPRRSCSATTSSG